MSITELFCAARKGLNLSQRDVAEIVGISQAAISGCEKSNFTLSKSTYITIAAVLKINPEFIDNPLSNPFRSSELIHFWVDDFFFTTSPLIKAIMEYRKKLDILFLLSEGKDPINTGLSIRDGDKNIFLFTLRKSRRVRQGDIMEWIGQCAKQMSDRPYTVNAGIVNLPKALIRKIVAERISKNDILRLYKKDVSQIYSFPSVSLSESSTSAVELSSGEQKLIGLIRELQIHPDELVRFLNCWQLRT